MAANFRYDLVQTLDVKDQPKLDSDFTKGRFSGQVSKNPSMTINPDK